MEFLVNFLYLAKDSILLMEGNSLHLLTVLPPVSVRGPDLKREEEIEEDYREEEDRPEVKAEKSKKDEKGAKEDEQLRRCLGKS